MSVFGIWINLSEPCPAIRDMREIKPEQLSKFGVDIGEITILIYEGHPEGGIVREGFQFLPFFGDFFFGLLALGDVTQVNEGDKITFISGPSCGYIKIDWCPVFFDAFKFISGRNGFTSLSPDIDIIDESKIIGVYSFAIVFSNYFVGVIIGQTFQQNADLHRGAHPPS